MNSSKPGIISPIGSIINSSNSGSKLSSPLTSVNSNSVSLNLESVMVEGKVMTTGSATLTTTSAVALGFSTQVTVNR